MYYIRTKYGQEYHVTDKGDIVRLDIRGFAPSGQWLMKGIADRHGRMVCRFEELGQWLESHRMVADIQYQNGNPRYTVMDVDHGTTRVWGNMKYHGIAVICKIAEVA